MRLSPTTILARLTAGALLLNVTAPAVLAAQGEGNPLKQNWRLAPELRPAMKGVPTVWRQAEADPTQYVDLTRKDPVPFAEGWTILNEQGRFRLLVSSAMEKAWRIELGERPTTVRRARLLVMLGEADIAHREPARAQARLDEAARIASPASPDRGLARFDSALSLFRQGRFALAKNAFRAAAMSRLRGVDAKIAALYARHAELCEGYHQQRERMGIPEPERLDPQCGMAALAVCLRGRHMPYDHADLARKVSFDGEGSSTADLQDALPKLGLVGRMVTADEEGLKKLPKPLVAFVEHDHFVAVVDADRTGVEYVCSDCGPWPGGPVRLSWKQWRAMEAGQFLAVAKRGTPEAMAIEELPTSKEQGTGHVAVASVRPQDAGAVAAAQRMLSLLGTSVIAQGNTPSPQAPLVCGTSAFCLHCLPGQILSLFGGGFSGSLFSTGDPVNLATGEEEYTAQTGFSVYNPTGPSVSFKPSYFSLANTTPNGFGRGWTHPYNMRIVVPSASMPIQLANGMQATLILPNSGRINFSVTVSNGNIGQYTGYQQYITTGGVPVSIEYDSGTHGFRVVFDDHSKWNFQYKSPGGGTGLAYYPTSIADRKGKTIGLTWSPMTCPNNIDVDRGGTPQSMGLTAITGSSGNLLTLAYAAGAGGRFASATDCFGRALLYNVLAKPTTNVPSASPQFADELTQVSQLVASNATSGPARFTYGYVNHNNRENAGLGDETIPFLATISVPSPTGTGMSTATIHYDDTNNATYGEVTDVVDANGNTATFSPGMVGTTPQPNSTRVKVKDAASNLVAQYDAYYDANMSATKRVNGAGQTVYTRSYSDSNAPYSPTDLVDGNGRSSSATYDRKGHATSRKSPKGTVTTLAYYNPSGVGGGVVPADLKSAQAYGHTKTEYDYVDNTGLPDYSNSPQPGAAANSGATVQTNYTYTLMGQAKTVATPGNDASSTKTWTYEYETDGAYTQPERFGQPIKVTDPLGHAAHYRYDAHGNLTSSKDALGNETTYDYTFDDRPFHTFAPHTGWGASCLTTTRTYLYTGGPLMDVNVSDEDFNTLRSSHLGYGAEGETLARTGSAEAVSLTYDASYRTKTVADGNAHATTYTYDTSGRLTKVSHPLASGANYDQVQFSDFDPVGHTTKRTDGNGQVANYTYGDGDGLLSEVNYVGHAADKVTLAYDDLDRVTASTDGAGSSGTVYDDLGNPTSGTRTYTGTPTQTFTYDYYSDGSRRTMGNVIGTWTYRYDAAGRYTSMASPAGTSSAYYYDNDWQSDRVLPNSVQTTYEYTQAGALRHQYTNRYGAGGTTAYSDYLVNYRDGMFNPTDVAYSVAGNVGSTGYVDYTYDAKNRLTGEQSSRFGGYAQNQTFDGAGNPATVNGVSAAGYYTADNQWRRPDLPGVYDGNGAPTTYNGPQEFDVEGRLTKASFSGSAAFSAGYRADGLRAWKASGPGTGARTYFYYDRGEPVLELDASGAWRATNAFAPDGLVGRLATGASSWAYYAFDLQGSAAQRLDGGGNVTSATGYDAWGASWRYDGAPSDPFAYDARWGYYRDAETGYCLCGHRYYDTLGRWVTRDPIGFAGGVNLYGYCGGNPVGRVDPSGLQMTAGAANPDDSISVAAFDAAAQATEAAQAAEGALAGEAAALEGAATAGAGVPAGAVPPLDEDPVPSTSTQPWNRPGGQWPDSHSDISNAYGPPRLIPDGADYPGRNKMRWDLGSGWNITCESHAYDGWMDPGNPAWERHYFTHSHLNGPGGVHLGGFIAGDPLPNAGPFTVGGAATIPSTSTDP